MKILLSLLAIAALASCSSDNSFITTCDAAEKLAKSEGIELHPGRLVLVDKSGNTVPPVYPTETTTTTERKCR